MAALYLILSSMEVLYYRFVLYPDPCMRMSGRPGEGRFIGL